ncbi:phenylacetate-CoA oxygenase subunit PaaB [Cesiribacter andamanensis]|uniref:Phenylacetate-CoA oxygenase subunit PaaB n=1 Tax=Cesiribacter andamanensis AMV16 TaxID=1279009 RepID=M7NBA9_9BACT|nr:phenylacetate-CoA oxygenase subunit PaaB [Cesiribacter andamanensis]EMR04562.1 phenylacetate-CoA oxygenase subunit PaaB [Cesiribacter andamanensis AMV16]
MASTFIQSLDPRVTRLQMPEDINQQPLQSEALDQLVTFQVFMQKKEGKNFEHAGIVHAPTVELALLYAKEQYSRRFTCSGMAVAETSTVMASPYTDGGISVYQLLEGEAEATTATADVYEVFHLMKRGKQHEHAGSVEANSVEDAFYKAKESLMPEKPVLNIWLIRRDDLLTVDEEDKDIWNTLPEKGYRDAAAYKAGDKLKDFKEKNEATSSH